MALGAVVFDGVVREALTSSTTDKVTFGGVVRSSLISATVPGIADMVFAGVVRETLVLYVPNANIFRPNFGSIPIFPTLPQGFPIKISPSMDTVVGTTKSLREMRVPQRLLPLWDIEILFEELKDQTQNQVPYSTFAGFEQYQELVQLWVMMYGQSNVFAFDCPWDNSRTDQSIGVGNGTTIEFIISRTWGTGSTATTAPVGMINVVTNVKVNGIIVPTSQYYTDGNILRFVGSDGQPYPPAIGEAVTMTFSFYYLCRFVEDEQDFEEFALNRWTVPSLKFRAVTWVFG
jgi:hypothetical protein